MRDSKERKDIRKIINSFMKLLDLSAKFTIRLTKYELWSVRFQEFDGSMGQQLLLNAHLAVQLSNMGIQNVVVHWS